MSISEVETRDDLFDDLLGDFLDESSELLDRLNDNLLELENWVKSAEGAEHRRCDEVLLNEMFRAAHSFKGLSGMLGLADINHLTHKIENIFDAARNDSLTIDREVVDLIFRSVDRLVVMVDRLNDPDREAVDCERILDEIGRLLGDAEVAIDPNAQGMINEFTNSEDQGETSTVDQAEMPGQDALEEEATTFDEPAQNKVSSVPDPFVDVVDEQDIPDKYLSIFIDETEMSLDAITEELLSDEQQKDSASLLVTCHRIKGSAASVGLNRPAKLSHVMEDILQELQESQGHLTPELIDVMLRCTDALRSYIDGLKRGSPESAGFGEVYLDLLNVWQSGAIDTKTDDGLVNEDESSRPSMKDDSSCSSSSDAAARAMVDEPALSDQRRAEIAASVPEGIPAYLVQIQFHPELPLVGLKARLVSEKLCFLGSLFYCHPADDLLDDLDELSTLIVGLATHEPPESIQGKLSIDGVTGVDVERLPASGGSPSRNPTEPSSTNPAAEAASRQSTAVTDTPRTNSTASVGKNSASEAVTKQGRAAGDNSKKPTETIRVDIDRLDQLMNLAGQLVISKARFAQITEGLKQNLSGHQAGHALANVRTILGCLCDDLDAQGSARNPELELDVVRSHVRRIQSDLETVEREVGQFVQARGSINDLAESVHQLDRVSAGIQKSVMDTRMVPIGPLFARFKRVIRDITRGNGKDINLIIRGEKTELDKRMIDELGDPLIHMVRNSADHGVELPQDRHAAGKPRHGTVTLDAFHRGNSIVIQVTDDGKGLNPEKLKEKAIHKGIIKPADADKLTPHQIYQLIWEPGFTTAEQVTDISGRGMGMDIVRTKIEELNGAVELDSEPGVGTTFTIKLPLTLAILPSLMAEIGGDVFAMPIESVVEIVRVEKKDLATIHGQPTACVRGRVISMVHLEELMNWGEESRSRSVRNEDATLVIASDGEEEIGLAVDRVLGEEDIVIKSMAENYRNVEGVAGASILGDGRVALILDVGTLVAMASARHTSANGA